MSYSFSIAPLAVLFHSMSRAIEQGQSTFPSERIPGGIRPYTPTAIEIVASEAQRFFSGIRLPRMHEVIPAATAVSLAATPAIVRAQEDQQNQPQLVIASYDQTRADNPVSDELSTAPEVAPLTGEFFRSRFVPNGEVNGEQVGYFADSIFNEEFNNNRTTWGEPRTQRWVLEDGSMMQLFDGALAHYDPLADAVTEVPVKDILLQQAGDAWMEEYGFNQPNVPAWMYAVSIRDLVPTEVHTPVKTDGLPIETPAPHEINVLYGKVVIKNQDPRFRATIENQALFEQFLSFGNSSEQRAGVVVHIVSSWEQMPSTNGIIEDGNDRNKPYIHPIWYRSMSGSQIVDANNHEYYARNHEGKIEMFLDISRLHDPSLSDEQRNYLASLYSLSILGKINGIGLSNKSPREWGSIPGGIPSFLTSEELERAELFLQSLAESNKSLLSITT